MLKSIRKSKNRYFYHIFVSPGHAPDAITLNVVWMEREFDAYKLSRSMYPSIFNSFPVIPTASANKKLSYRWQTARCCFVKLLRYCRTFCQTRMLWLPDGEKISKIFLTWSTNVTDGRTDRQTPHADIYRAYAHASRGKNYEANHFLKMFLDTGKSSSRLNT